MPGRDALGRFDLSRDLKPPTFGPRRAKPASPLRHIVSIGTGVAAQRAPILEEQEMTVKNQSTLELRSVETGPLEDGAETVLLHTDGGTIDCRFHPAETGDVGVLWVFVAGGGLGGPAGGLYTRLAAQLAPEGVASLRLDYRRPGALTACVLDVLVGIAYLGSRGRSRVVLVGHSFGGAVVITAGAVSPEVIGVAALSSQTAGTGQVGNISPRPLLLMHGTDDEILPDACSRDLYQRAGEPRRLLLYENCRHGLDDCRDEIDRDLLGWIREVVQGTAVGDETNA